jgi:hypothetical protein
MSDSEVIKIIDNLEKIKRPKENWHYSVGGFETLKNASERT